MKYDDLEPIPEGMMDRIEQKLEKHVSQRKRAARLRSVTLAVAIALVLPLSVFAVINVNWGWRDGIEVAAENGKSIKLNSVFELNNHKIIFEDAVFEDYALLVSYSVPDNKVMPRDVLLVNDKGTPVCKSNENSYDKKGKGYMKFNLKDDMVKGENLYLLVNTLEKQGEPPLYNCKLNLEKPPQKGKVSIDKQFDTDYGTLSINSAGYYGERLYFDYNMTELPEVAKYNNSKKVDGVIYSILFPEIVLKDSSMHEIYGYTTDNGKIEFGVVPNDFTPPVTMSVRCSQQLVNWKIPIKIEQAEEQVIKLDKKISVQGGTLSISNLHLGDASTYLDYSFKPEKGKSIISISPGMLMTVNGQIYVGQRSTDDYFSLSGKILFPYPLNSKSLENTSFNLSSIELTENCNEIIKIRCSKTPTEYDILGSKLEVSKMERKNGKTFIEMVLKDDKREFFDFYYGINAGVSSSGGSVIAFNDKKIEEKYRKNRNLSLMTKEELSKAVISKSITVNGGFDELELDINKLIYINEINSSFKVK